MTNWPSVAECGQFSSHVTCTLHFKYISKCNDVYLKPRQMFQIVTVSSNYDSEL